MLTIHEGIERDELLDVQERDNLFAEARAMLHEMLGIGTDTLGRAQVDQAFAEARMKLLKRRKDREDKQYQSEAAGTDIEAAGSEDAAASLVAVCLPEERRRIRELLDDFPQIRETKISTLIHALGQLWNLNPAEKIVIFTTYLGSVDGIREAIDETFPGKGVEVLKGGDHGAKTAAQKRFKRDDGPRVLVCTAAGREGINLQFARVLFNHDLSWNPMDMEQRAGRIHRYGQQHTAQIYNLVAADTIEGQIFLLLEEKLKAIAETLGKVDDQGQVAEDLRSQVLGQLADRLSYDRLYQEAVFDPTLRRTKEELEVAMSNATSARHVVFELFQDLDQFNVSEYQQYEDGGAGMDRLLDFTKRIVHRQNGQLQALASKVYDVSFPGKTAVRFTVDRESAMQNDELDLLGLEHPMLREAQEGLAAIPPEERCLIIEAPGDLVTRPSAYGVWQVVIDAGGGTVLQRIVKLAVQDDGQRSVVLERRLRSGYSDVRATAREFSSSTAQDLTCRIMPSILHRELEHQGVLQNGAGYSSKLLALLLMTPGTT
jgi:hypothetical protein